MKKITPFTNVGKTWTGDDGHIYKLIKNSRPKITVSVSTYRGISIGAIHFYCRVSADTPAIRDVTEGRTLFMGGYGPDKPEIDYSFEAKRKVTKVEKDASGDVVAPVGEMTGRFNDPEEALRAGIELLKETFADTPKHKWRICFDPFLDGWFETTLDSIDLDEILSKVDLTHF